MIFDTDIFIWIQRGNGKAARVVEATSDRCLSLQTYLELIQGAQNKKQHETVKGFLKEYGFRTIPFSANIGHRAAVYMEEYSLSHGLRAGDAIIAATATESNMELCSGNAKHFRSISDLKLKVFRP